MATDRDGGSVPYWMCGILFTNAHTWVVRRDTGR